MSYVAATRSNAGFVCRSFRHVSGNILLSTMRVCRLVRFDHSLTLSAPFFMRLSVPLFDKPIVVYALQPTVSRSDPI